MEVGSMKQFWIRWETEYVLSRQRPRPNAYVGDVLVDNTVSRPFTLGKIIKGKQ